jgi:hypothetical protein
MVWVRERTIPTERPPLLNYHNKINYRGHFENICCMKTEAACHVTVLRCTTAPSHVDTSRCLQETDPRVNSTEGNVSTSGVVMNDIMWNRRDICEQRELREPSRVWHEMKCPKQPVHKSCTLSSSDNIHSIFYVVRSRNVEITAVGILQAGQVLPSIRKRWH